MRSRWLTRRALLLHLVVAIVVPGCGLAAWWQVTIALAGDGLGWLYSVEWPCFAIFALVVWWNLIHDDPATVGTRALRRGAPARAGDDGLDPTRLAAAEAEDPKLAAYNAYLEQLARAAPERGRPQ